MYKNADLKREYVNEVFSISDTYFTVFCFAGAISRRESAECSFELRVKVKGVSSRVLDKKFRLKISLAGACHITQEITFNGLPLN